MKDREVIGFSLIWEILVERKVLQLNEYLEVYGEGADFNDASSRITDIGSVPTHSKKGLINNSKDILNNLEIENVRYDFERLIGFDNGFYANIPPFNFALVQDEDMEVERVFLLEEIRFELQVI
ncbi:hypothetical protein [Chitinophaga alhagiae]|uniref:hypothetical protein n=1 Tax=Chitinophaga alhagiae TaxID=2203219 RepID=UPI0018E4E2DA|nr:hypothetical protein [Chitinophaga alhagiae]